MAKIVIHRPKEYINQLISYTVYLDEKKIGYIENNKITSFEVSPGEHTLYCKIDWARSNKINFIMSTEEMNFKISGFKHSELFSKYGIPLSVVLICLGFFIPFRYLIIPLIILALPLLYYLTIGYNKYLVLKIADKNT